MGGTLTFYRTPAYFKAGLPGVFFECTPALHGCSWGAGAAEDLLPIRDEAADAHYDVVFITKPAGKYYPLDIGDACCLAGKHYLPDLDF